jgi:Na+(H+)/acetate symporter ActP
MKTCLPAFGQVFGLGIFAVITAIAFATILGTVSGLIGGIRSRS